MASFYTKSSDFQKYKNSNTKKTSQFYEGNESGSNYSNKSSRSFDKEVVHHKSKQDASNHPHIPSSSRQNDAMKQNYKQNSTSISSNSKQDKKDDFTDTPESSQGQSMHSYLSSSQSSSSSSLEEEENPDGEYESTATNHGQHSSIQSSRDENDFDEEDSLEDSNKESIDSIIDGVGKNDHFEHAIKKKRKMW